MALQRAPAEVLGLCLREAHCPEDVGAAIRASRAFLNAFRCQEQAILTSVLERCMSADALQQALLITKCPVWANGDNRHCDDCWDDVPHYVSDMDDTVWGEKYIRFEWEHRDKAPRSPHDSFLDALTLTTICRLRANVNCIIADYIAFTKSVSDRHGPEPAMLSPGKSELRKLSENELGRLQGAFLRYELYCRSWGWPYFHSWMETLTRVSLNESFFVMGGQVDPWAKEELVVVHRYVMAKYTAMFQEIVQDFTATISTVSITHHEPLTNPIHPSVRELLGEDGPKFLLEIGWRSRSTTDLMDFWRSHPQGWGQGYVTICADNFSRLGLGFLLNMLRSGRQSRRDLIRDVFDIFCPREGSWFPPKASNFVWPAEDLIDDPGERSLELMKAGGNSAWKVMMSWFDDNDRLNYAQHSDIERLRKLGWVFWDDERLLDLEILYRREVNDQGDDGHFNLPLDLNPFLSTQQLYGELRLRAPILPVLRQRVSRDDWAEKVVPHFYTKPHPGFRNPDMRRGPCESSERLMEIVGLADQVALDRCQ